MSDAFPEGVPQRRPGRAQLAGAGGGRTEALVRGQGQVLLLLRTYQLLQGSCTVKALEGKQTVLDLRRGVGAQTESLLLVAEVVELLFASVLDIRV